MYVKLVLALIVFCAVIVKTNSERGYQDGRPHMQGYIRIKRGKYNSGPPQRFYSRPPPSFPNRGVFSYTPPPGYMIDDGEPPFPGPRDSRPPKVSKAPTNAGLGEEDLNNLVKYLSKQDLDKIVEFASANKDNNQYIKNSYESPEYNNNKFKSTYSFADNEEEKYSLKTTKDDASQIFQATIQDINTDPKYNTLNRDSKPYGEYEDKPSIQYTSNADFKPNTNFVTEPTPLSAFYADPQINQVYGDTQFETEESKIQKKIAYLAQQDGVLYTDSKIIEEENLPKPMNLRDDFEVSNTDNVATVVKAETSSSYKLENFQKLPLMNYDSKLDTLSSYHVPHYTVTSPAKQSLSSSYAAPSSFSSGKVPPLEPAPPVSAAKAQSDAHLKAIRIWTHKSRGTAYTLHNDGTLSLERPGRPSGSYGSR